MRKSLGLLLIISLNLFFCDNPSSTEEDEWFTSPTKFDESCFEAECTTNGPVSSITWIKGTIGKNGKINQFVFDALGIGYNPVGGISKNGIVSIEALYGGTAIVKYTFEGNLDEINNIYSGEGTWKSEIQKIIRLNDKSGKWQLKEINYRDSTRLYTPCEIIEVNINQDSVLVPIQNRGFSTLTAKFFLVNNVPLIKIDDYFQNKRVEPGKHFDLELEIDKNVEKYGLNTDTLGIIGNDTTFILINIKG